MARFWFEGENGGNVWGVWGLVCSIRYGGGLLGWIVCLLFLLVFAVFSVVFVISFVAFRVGLLGFGLLLVTLLFVVF